MIDRWPLGTRGWNRHLQQDPCKALGVQGAAMAFILPALGGHGVHCPGGAAEPTGQGLRGDGAAQSHPGGSWPGATRGRNPERTAAAILAISTPQGLRNLRGLWRNGGGTQSSPLDPPVHPGACAPAGPSAGGASMEHLGLPPEHLAQQQPEPAPPPWTAASPPAPLPALLPQQGGGRHVTSLFQEVTSLGWVAGSSGSDVRALRSWPQLWWQGSDNGLSWGSRRELDPQGPTAGAGTGWSDGTELGLGGGIHTWPAAPTAVWVAPRALEPAGSWDF